MSAEQKQKWADSSRRLRAAKKRFIDEAKMAAGCRDCGESDPVVLDMHHRNPATKNPELKKKQGSQRLSNLAWPDLRTELTLCDVLCANCHRRLHARGDS